MRTARFHQRIPRLDNVDGAYRDTFWVLGERGATVLMFFDYREYSDWPLGEKVLAADFGIHSVKPRGNWDDIFDPCDFLGESGCHYSGSGLHAMHYLPAYLADDQETIYSALEAAYRDEFSDDN